MAEQGNWRFCGKCAGLFWGGATTNISCPAGGAHRSEGHLTYSLPHGQGVAGPTVQPDWAHCDKCRGLFYTKYGRGKCPGDKAGHNAEGYEFALPHGTSVPSYHPNWRYCDKCRGLFYPAYGGGVCPAGDKHNAAGFLVYALPMDRSPVAAPTAKQFADAYAKARAGGLNSKNLEPAIRLLNDLPMKELLSAFEKLDPNDRHFICEAEVSVGAANRFKFARDVIVHREITNRKLPLDQVNAGRAYLGCTPLDDAEVRKIIDDSLTKARAAVPTDKDFSAEPCCGIFKYAWTMILVPKRRKPGCSLISNLAAAAHYMLARYHVCAVKASKDQMNTISKGYDEKKRWEFANGDRDLMSMATTDNPPYPPDFAILGWALKGADDGDVDRLRCNPTESLPVVPVVNKAEWGVE